MDVEPIYWEFKSTNLLRIYINLLRIYSVEPIDTFKDAIFKIAGWSDNYITY